MVVFVIQTLHFTDAEFAEFCDATNLTKWFYDEDTFTGEFNDYLVIIDDFKADIKAAFDLQLNDKHSNMLEWMSFWVNRKMLTVCPVIMFGE